MPLEEEPVDRHRRMRMLRERLRRLGQAMRSATRFLFSRPWHARRAESEDGEPIGSRFFRALAYRALFVPIFLALAAAALVYRGTHPIRGTSDNLPAVPGTFYETLEFKGSDNLPLMAWFVPMVDERRVIELKEKIFKAKYAAVVLVHDYNQSPSQMVPLIGPLHEQGLAVAVVGLRGVGRGRAAAQTFGINESADVRAAIAELRKLSTIDGQRLAVVGVGTGASAAVLAAAQDSGVKAIALINPIEETEQVIARYLGPTQPGLAWMQEASKWAFEVAYHLDADDLSLSSHRQALAGRATISLTCLENHEFDEDTIGSVTSFCQKNLAPLNIAAATAN